MQTLANDKDRAVAAVEAAVDRLCRVVRSAGNPEALAIGEWSVRDVAAHVAGGIPVHLSIIRGEGSTYRALDRIAESNAAALAEITERNCGVLADRIEAGMADLAAAARARPGDPQVAWHGGLPMPLSSELALLLGELLVHGYDIARASGQPWTIPPADAGLVFAGAVPVLPYLVNQAAAVGVCATFDVRLRGYGCAAFVFEGGSLQVLPQPDGPVDCRLSADPVAFLLVMFGRSDPIRQVLTGKVVAWGRKPWLGLMLPRLLLSP
ncbi:MAG: maleylpyruvate isomerase family mycothiol-dependent enzyme [Pseudonocardiaceae bacterium]